MFNIIKILSANAGGFPLSSSELAGEIGCSSRTVKRDLARLSDDQFLPENGLCSPVALRDTFYRLLIRGCTTCVTKILIELSNGEKQGIKQFSIVKLLLVNGHITQENGGAAVCQPLNLK